MQIDPVCGMEVKEEEAFTAECEGTVSYFCSEGCRDSFLKNKTRMLERRVHDLIIVGGGPAGLTASVYAATLKMNAFLITKNLGGQAMDSKKIENYLGFDFITGPELIEQFRHHLLHSHYIDHLMSEAEKIEPVEGGYNVTAGDLNTYFAPTVIISTGMTRRRLGVPGEEEFQRRGIFYGHIQDISFVQGEAVAVIGGGNSALQIVEILHPTVKSIHLVSHSTLKADPSMIERIGQLKNVRRYEGYTIVEFSGEDRLSGVTIRKKAEREKILLPVRGVFVAIGLYPNVSLVADLTEVNERGEIVIKPDCSTSSPGLFAAGDVTNAYGKRIIIASGEGAKAAMAARHYLLNLRKRRLQP